MKFTKLNSNTCSHFEALKWNGGQWQRRLSEDFTELFEIQSCWTINFILIIHNKKHLVGLKIIKMF